MQNFRTRGIKGTSRVSPKCKSKIEYSWVSPIQLWVEQAYALFLFVVFPARKAGLSLALQVVVSLFLQNPSKDNLELYLLSHSEA